MTKLPINLNGLLRQRTVEGDRIEYKAGWNPDPIIRTVCAFANDCENLGGGYVVIGQDCDANGQPVFPPVGLADNQLDKIQQELLAACQLIQPPYFPALSVEEIEGRKLVMLQAPGGMHRPYKAPASVSAKHKTWHYYIRRYSSTVEAKGGTELELLKHPDRAEATRVWNFPYVAIEEAVVNAVYHRSYEEREPIEVRISYDELVILSFPGPDRSIKTKDFEAGRSVNRRYRNRRIGEFLKELDLTEGRSTGVPKILKAMAANGSPAPCFETDADRLSCLIRLPVHPLAKRPDGDVTDQVTDQATGEVARLLAVAARGEHTRNALQEALSLKHTPHFRQAFLLPALEAGLIEMTQPDKPRSSNQRYRLTRLGQRWLDTHSADSAA